MKISKNKKGFTLIELLVVIAIIGILSGIVLVSVSSARNKAKDARIQADLAQVRSLAETLYSGTTYPDGAAGSNNGFDNVVTTGGTAPSCTGDTTRDLNLLKIDGDVRAQQGAACNAASADTVGILINKNAGDTAYAAQAKLVGTGYWCVDSTGNSKAESAALGAGTVCP